MAARVNTQFVLILIGALVLLTVTTAGAYYYLVVLADPSRNIERAEQLVAVGDFEGASDQYGRAFRKQPTDLAVLYKLIETTEKIETEDRQHASIQLQRIISSHQQATTLRPADAEVLQRYLELLKELRMWDRIGEVTNNKLESHRDMLVARKYRAMAQVNRMAAGLPMNDAERDQPREDLLQVLQANPTDADALYYMALWSLTQAQHHSRPGGDPDLIEPSRAEALRAAEQLAEAHPNDPQAMGNYIRLMVQLEQRERAAAMLDRLEGVLLDKPEPIELVIQASEWLRQLRSGVVETEQGEQAPAGMHAAMRMLETGLARHPDSLQVQIPLARWMMLSGQHERAMELLTKVRRTPPKVTPLQSVRAFALHDTGTVLYCDIALRQVDGADAAKKEATLQEVETLAQTVARANPGLEGWTKMLQAKVHLARGSRARAADAMDEAIAAVRSGRGGDLSMLTEAYLISAQLRSQLGHWGAAATSYRDLMLIRPDLKHLRVQLAEVHLQGQQLFDAERVIAAVLEEEPTHYVARLQQARLRTLQERYDEAIRLSRALLNDEAPALEARIDVVANLAQTLVRMEREAEAEQLVVAEFEKNPSNPRLLQFVLSITKDETKSSRYLEMARTAGADPRLLEVLDRVGSGDAEEVVKMAEERAAAIEDPFTRHMELYRLYEQLGDAAKAKANFDQAASIKPNDARVIEVQFNDALAARQWDRAAQLAAKARDVDADLAGGMYFVGVLEAAQGKHGRAITNFQTALRTREKFPDAWHRLGMSQAATGDLTAATNSYTQALNQQPNHVGAILGLADVQSRLGNHAEALEHLRRAARSSNNPAIQDQYLRYEQQYGDKAAVLERRVRILERQPENMANRRSLALLYADMGDADNAIATVNALIEADGRTLMNAEVQAQVLLNVNQPEAAMRAMNAYLSEQGRDATAEDWLALARLRWMLGLEAPSLEAFEEARKVEDPQTRPATRAMAQLMQQVGRTEDYVRLLQVLWNDDPTDHTVGQALAVALAEVGKADEAQAVIGKLPSAHQHDIDTLVARATIAMARRDSRTAVTILTQAIEREPNRPMLYFQRAAARTRTAEGEAVRPEDMTQAQLDLEEAVRLNPSYIQARRALSQLHLQQNRLNDAVAELQSIIEREPRSLQDRLQLADLLMRAERWTQLNTLLEESARVFPTSSTWPWLRGRAARAQQQPDVALANFTKALSMQASPQNLAEVVLVHLEARRGGPALQHLDEHASLVERNAVLRAMRGRALVYLQRETEAASEFRTALEQCNNGVVLHEVIGQVGSALNFRRAMEFASEQFPLSSASADTVWVHLTLSEVESRLTDYEAVEKRLRAIDPLVARDSEYRLPLDRALAVVYHMLDRKEEAVRRYQAVLEHEPNNPGILNNLAFLLCDGLNQPQQALPYAQRAAELAPVDPSVLDTLGWVQFNAGQESQGIQTLRRGLEIRPLPDTYFHLGEIYRRQGVLDEARQMFELARQLADRMGRDDLSERARERLEGMRTP